MLLKPDVIVRDEGDDRWLYNGENGALVSVERPAFHRLIERDDAADPHYAPLRDWLLEGGFLRESPPPERRRTLGPREVQATTGFFALKSDRAPLNLLWAITPRCNLRCVYCFPDVASHRRGFEEKDLPALLRVAQSILEAKVFKVTLTGGECLLSPHVWPIAERLRAGGVTVAVLSNGTDVSERTIERLRATGISIGVSLDAPDEETNAVTRGTGAFERTRRSLERLISAGIPTSVLVTVTRHNADRLEEHVGLLDALGAEIVVLQDLRPFGTPTHYDAARMTVEQERRLPERLAELAARHPRLALNTTELLLFRQGNPAGTVMPCPAGVNFGYVDFLGDLYPCTSLPSFRMGNLFAGETLSGLWQSSPAARDLRALQSLPLDRLPGCVGCANAARCGGGCRGDALFHDGSLFGCSSRCPKRMGLLDAPA